MKYVFVLGNCRSGTSWVSRTLSQSSTPLYYLEEPFVKLTTYTQKRFFEPWSFFCEDTQSIDFYRRIIDCLPYNVSMFKPNESGVSNTSHPKYILLKEIHNLPAFFKLISGLEYKIIFVRRNLFRSLDSWIYNFGGFDSWIHNFVGGAIYKDEYIWLRGAILGDFIVSDPFYLSAANLLPTSLQMYLRNSIDKVEAYIKLFIILLFNQLVLQQWSKVDRNIYTLQYEELCRNNIVEFSKVFDFVEFTFDDDIVEFIDSCTKNENRNDPYDIHRKHLLLGNTSYKILTSEQIAVLTAIMGG